MIDTMYRSDNILNKIFVKVLVSISSKKISAGETTHYYTENTFAKVLKNVSCEQAIWPNLLVIPE